MEPHVRCAIILPPTDASFRTIAGLPLIQRTALSALRGGFERVVAMAGRDGERLRAVLARDARTRAIPVVDGPVAPIVDAEHVALLPSDALVTAATLRRVATTESDGSALAFRADGAATDDPGVLLVARERLAALDDSADGPAAVGRLLGARAVSLNGELCIPAPDARAAARAEDALVAQVAASSAATDGPIARMDRAVSTRLSRLLVTTPIRPNHVTLIGTAIGFLSAWMFAQGTYWSGVLGSLLFWFAVIIDGCDGEVAKLTFQESRFGHWLDIVTDNIVHVAIFVGLAVGQYRAAPDGNYETLIVILLIGFTLSSFATFLCLVRHPPVRLQRPQTRRGKLRQRLLRGFELLMNRDFAYLLVGLALIGRLGWFLWGTAFGIYAYALGLFAVYRWRDAE